MKLHKWLAAAGVVAISGAGAFVAAPEADAAITITAGPGSSVTCDFNGSAKLAPTLVNDWSQAAHQADPATNATLKSAIASIADVTYSVAGPVSTSAKGTGVCTGTVTDGVNSTTVTAVKVASSSTGTSTDPATCSGLSTPSVATYTSTLSWTGATAKVAPSVGTSGIATLVDAHGVGFTLASTSVTGSFAGGSTVSNVYIDANTFNAATGGPADSATPVPVSPCEAALSIKFTAAGAANSGVGDSVSVKLKKPKGLKGITLGPGLFDATPSSIVASA